ncbi:MAG TPA: hypothetical protein VH255_04405 [Verrucomicrobiae bacterium]|jgi:hypothetical protein|nr:hypothetical protein [Verrucomicrobiae bacterium]
MSTLLNAKQVAAQIGRNENYITAMKRAGYELPYPGRTTLEHILAWLAHNRATFIASHYLMAGWQALPKLPAPPQA